MGIASATEELITFLEKVSLVTLNPPESSQGMAVVESITLTERGKELLKQFDLGADKGFKKSFILYGRPRGDYVQK
jgi:hypothetical protein